MQAVYFLERDWEKVKVAYKQRGGNPLKHGLFLCMGLLSAVLSLTWLLHIVLYIFVDPPADQVVLRGANLNLILTLALTLTSMKYPNPNPNPNPNPLTRTLTRRASAIRIATLSWARKEARAAAAAASRAARRVADPRLAHPLPRAPHKGTAAWEEEEPPPQGNVRSCQAEDRGPSPGRHDGGPPKWLVPGVPPEHLPTSRCCTPPLEKQFACVW